MGLINIFFIPSIGRLSGLAGTSPQPPPPTGVRCAFSEAWNASISSISLPAQRRLYYYRWLHRPTLKSLLSSSSR
uniref:Uncharacterized protein n=1 Tax=Trichogramma kaykai TaxID=54128 RepID=A0ABD2XEF8_9HYME